MAKADTIITDPDAVAGENPAAQPEKLDDIMLAMDVVDTLRHDANMLDLDLRTDDRRKDLIARLRDIYAAQGIDVPDSILMDGVKALEEERFKYEPRKPSFSTKLAKLYINRAKWGKLFGAIAVLVGLGWAVNYAAFEAPKKKEAARLETLFTQDLPQRLELAYSEAKTASTDAAANERIETLYQNGQSALRTQTESTARSSVENLENLRNTLQTTYSLRIVGRPGETTGFTRTPDAAPDTKNYYIVVEAIDPSGQPVEVQVASEEFQDTALTSQWAMRVYENDFLRIAADKQDDQIIQNSIVGEKKRGVLTPTYKFKTPGGVIWEW